MQYLPNSDSPWVTYQQLVKTPSNPTGLILKTTFDQAKHRGNVTVTCRGGNGNPVLIEFDTMPKHWQEQVRAEYGDPKQYIAMEPLRKMVVADDVARVWYSQYRLSDGKPLPLEYQQMYSRQADWLNVISRVMVDKRAVKDYLQITMEQFWDNITLLATKDDYLPKVKSRSGEVYVGHRLPGSVTRLYRKWKQYSTHGYKALVDTRNFCNDFRRVVSPKIEWLLCSIYYQPHKPTLKEVCVEFNQFMKGLRVIVDIHPDHGGEVFNPEEFYVKGKPYRLGESTVDFYVKQPYNEAMMNKRRMKAQDYNTIYRPSVKRVAPFYAFSKITMDDILLPFDGPDGKRECWSYQVFDVASTAVIGYAFAKDKNKDLRNEALRNMYRLIVNKGWGMPYEIEMEHHLNDKSFGSTNEAGVWEDDLFTPGAIFMASRLCRGGNAQEKRAEGFIKQKKYQFQKKRPGFKGRFYAKLLTNRLNEDQKALRQVYEEVVAHELEDIDLYNNSLHPNQDLYPGLTRWQVLEQYQNPNLAKHHPSSVMKYLGYSTTTSIRAGRAQVQYGQYALPDIDLIKNQTYNGELVAYYLPNDEGEIESVHLYEDGNYLCEAKRLVGFQDAVIERTEADVPIMEQQWGQQKRYDKIVKEGIDNMGRVGLTPPTPKGEYAKPKPLSKKIAAVEYVDTVPVDVYREDAAARARAMM